MIRRLDGGVRVALRMKRDVRDGDSLESNLVREHLRTRRVVYVGIGDNGELSAKVRTWRLSQKTGN